MDSRLWEVLLLIIGVTTIDVNGNIDSVLSRTRRLIKGDDVEDGLPQVGVLAYKNEASHSRPYHIICTLVVLNNQWLLTAAHCVDESVFPRLDDDEPLMVVVGLTDNSEENDPEDVQERSDYQIFAHPDFCQLFVITNDIALIKVNEPLTLNDRVQPIELPPPGIYEAKGANKAKCKIFGWGIESFPVTDDSFSRYMKEGDMKVKDCKDAFGGQLSEDHMCAVGKGVQPCSGDSGAPLFCEVDDESYFFGIDSFGQFLSCEKKSVQVLTNVGYFLDFIQNTMAAN